MPELAKIIFGKTYKFGCEEENIEILEKSVGLYPNSNAEAADVFVNISTTGNQDEDRMIAQNPSIFIKKRKSIIMKFPQCEISWGITMEGGPLLVTLSVKKPTRTLRKLYSKFRSMEYSTEVEEFEQVLHELILVPSAYFFNDLSVVHAAVLAVNGKAILLAGTGGTGKTSALLSLRNEENVSFVSDDIAIVSKDGYVHPNLAWPKVYGYNLSTYITKEELLKGRGAIDKFQFDFKLKRNPKSVRRKLRPDYLYKAFKNEPVPIERVIYLFRDNSESIRLEDLEMEHAIQMGLHVMKTEYSSFHNFLEWDQYNSIVTGKSPLLRTDEVFENWRLNLTDAYKKADIKLLRIPFHLPHERYLDYMNKFVNK